MKAEQEKQEKQRQKSIEASPAKSSTASNAGTTVSQMQPALSKQNTANSMRAAPHSGPLQSPRQMGVPQQARGYGRGGFVPQPQPLPLDPRIPTGPAALATDAGPLSPGTKFNPGAKAFEFRPAANAFTPVSATSQSRERSVAKTEPVTAEVPDFFKGRKVIDPKDRKNIDDAFNPLKNMKYPEAVSYTHLTLPTKRIV